MEEELKPGCYYFYVPCVNCGTQIAFQEAPPPDEVEQPKSRGVTVRCDQCGTLHTYRGAEVRRAVAPDSDE